MFFLYCDVVVKGLGVLSMALYSARRCLMGLVLVVVALVGAAVRRRAMVARLPRADFGMQRPVSVASPPAGVGGGTGEINT